MPYFTTEDGCKLFYRTDGDNAACPVVIFLNGATQTTLYWGTHAPAFARHFRLMFYDARSQGQSGLGSQPLTLDLHISDLSQLCTHLGIDKAHLVGISHGARLAAAFTHHSPHLVDRLVLCSLGDKTNHRSRAAVQSWLKILRLSGLEAMAWASLPTVFGSAFLKHHHKTMAMIVAAVVKRNNRKALIALLDAILDYPPVDRLPQELNRSTLVLSGSEDFLVNPKDARLLADLCRARYEELSSVGHSIPAEAPGRFERIVLEFLIKKQKTEVRRQRSEDR